MWIDDAVELLSRMRYTCALDITEAYPDGLPAEGVAWVFGVTRQAIDAEEREPAQLLRLALKEHNPNDA